MQKVNIIIEKLVKEGYLLDKTGMDTSVHHLQAHVSYILSYVSEHFHSVWFGGHRGTGHLAPFSVRSDAPRYKSETQM